MFSICLATPEPTVRSTYSGSLTFGSPTFSRPGGTFGNYYYMAIKVFTLTSSYYGFTSSGSLDIYGYFYRDSFNRSNPSSNLIAEDDNALGEGQFGISVPV